MRVDRLGRGRTRVALSRLDAAHPLTGEREVVYTSGEAIVRPREASVTLADCDAVPCPAGRVRVTVVTQTRLKHAGAFARRPDFQVRLRRLRGRLSSLARFHDGGPLDVCSIARYELRERRAGRGAAAGEACARG